MLSDGRFYAEGVFYDVTARRTAERALTHAEDRFRSLVERLPQIVYVEDAITGEDVYVSPQIEAVYGYTPEEWTQGPGLWEQSIHPDDRAWVVAADQEDTGDRWSVEHRSITRDGRVIWIHNDAELLRDGEGNPLYWQGVIYDISLIAVGPTEGADPANCVSSPAPAGSYAEVISVSLKARSGDAAVVPRPTI